MSHIIHVLDSVRTLTARELPGSSSNLYSVSGSSTHSLVLDLPESLADIRAKNHAERKQMFRDEFSLLNLGRRAG